MIRGLSPAARRLEEDREVGLDLPLADVLVQAPWPEGGLDEESASSRKPAARIRVVSSVTVGVYHGRRRLARMFECRRGVGAWQNGCLVWFR